MATDNVESDSRDAKGVCNDVHIVIHGQLSLEKRRIFVVDVPTMESQRDPGPTLVMVGWLKMEEAHLLDTMTLSQRASCMRSRIRISTAGIAISTVAICQTVLSRTEPPSFFRPPSCWEGDIRDDV